MSINRKTGVIKRIIPTKLKGNIVYSEEGLEKSITFFGLKTTIDQKRTNYILGDIVEFDIITKNYGENNFDIAQNLTFIENKNIEKFKLTYNPEKIYTGFLKKYEDTYFVKEINSYIQFKVSNITPKFIVPEENSAVKFHLKGNQIRTLKANILDLEINNEFLHFRESETHEATITGIDDNWVYVTLNNFNFTGRINIKNRTTTFHIGENILVIYAGIFKRNINFITIL